MGDILTIDLDWEAKNRLLMNAVRQLSTERLKELWDEWDGVSSWVGAESVYPEGIHQVLNERGEGRYCAV